MRVSSSLIFTVLVGICCVPTILAAEQFESADSISDETILLQMARHETTMGKLRKEEPMPCGYLLGNATGDPDTFDCNNAKYHSRKADFSRSIVDVMAEHPGADGFCYFNESAMYIVPLKEPRDYVNTSALFILSLRGADYAGLNTGPHVTFHIEGETLTSHIDSMHYVYDDLYGYSLGFLQGQGLDTSKITNATAWQELSEEHCNKIQQKYQFTKDELILNDLLDMNMPILAMSCCSAGLELNDKQKVPYVTEKAGYRSAQDCKQITHREYAKHHYMKCVLGYRNSAADMAYLHTRACLLEGNRIGHFQECPFTPEGLMG